MRPFPFSLFLLGKCSTYQTFSGSLLADSVSPVREARGRPPGPRAGEPAALAAFGVEVVSECCSGASLQHPVTPRSPARPHHRGPPASQPAGPAPCALSAVRPPQPRGLPQPRSGGPVPAAPRALSLPALPGCGVRACRPLSGNGAPSGGSPRHEEPRGHLARCSSWDLWLCGEYGGGKIEVLVRCGAVGPSVKWAAWVNVM